MKGVAAALVTAGFAPRVSRAAADALRTLQDDLRSAADGPRLWSRVREEFLLGAGIAHLNSGTLGATPRFVVDAVAGYMRELETDPVHQVFGPMGQAMEAVAAQAAAFLGADKGEVAITRNTTEGMNMVAAGLALRAGDEILTTNHEHSGGLSCWQYLAERQGVRIVQLKVPTPPQDKAAILQLIADRLTRRTRVCSVSHVETITGLQMPLADIAALVHKRGVLLVCDGAQAAGMLKVDVPALGVDTYATSAHKWMLAPKGSGLLYIRRAVQDRVRPIALREGYGVYSGSAGTRNVPHILGLGVALDFHTTLGRERIEARCRRLSSLLRERLKGVPALRMLSAEAPELSSAMFTMAVGRGRVADLVNRLFAERKIVVKLVPPTLVVDSALASEDYNALRFSTHIFNDENEVDRLAEALKAAVAA
jgi:selenocysteine lyase/cysteine desulfurase